MYLECYDEAGIKDLYDEFGATEESIKRDVNELMKWLEKQPHLPDVTDEEFLINFLLRCKNSLERAKSQLEVYYTNRATFPDIFTNRDPCAPEIQKCVNLCMYVSLPKLTPDGYRINLFRIFDEVKTELPRSEDLLKSIQMIMDVSLKRDRIKGLILIYDFRNVDIKFVSLILSQLKKLMQMSTKATPIRYHKVIILNINPSIEQVVTFCKSIVKKELADRVEVWRKKPEDLVEILPKEVLPSSYGGTLPPIEELRNKWFAFIKEHRDWLISQNDMKANLDRIPKESKLTRNTFEYGLEGSFRKITID